MPERREEREIAALYLELAAQCFNKSAAKDDVGTSDSMRRMGRVYVARAMALDPSLGAGQLSDFHELPR
jgi:hypothetical protein